MSGVTSMRVFTTFNGWASNNAEPRPTAPANIVTIHINDQLLIVSGYSNADHGNEWYDGLPVVDVPSADNTADCTPKKTPPPTANRAAVGTLPRHNAVTPSSRMICLSTTPQTRISSCTSTSICTWSSRLVVVEYQMSLSTWLQQ
jgi:hypothetical protein